MVPPDPAALAPTSPGDQRLNFLGDNMLNEKNTIASDSINAIADRNLELAAAHALPGAVIPAELHAFVPRVRAILGAINTLVDAVARTQDCVCPEYAPASEDEAHRWLDLLSDVRADLARILAGAKSCDAELATALEELRAGDIRTWRAISRHIVQTAYAEELIYGGDGAFHTDCDGAVLSAIGVKPRRKPGKTKGRKATAGKRGGK